MTVLAAKGPGKEVPCQEKIQGEGKKRAAGERQPRRGGEGEVLAAFQEVWRSAVLGYAMLGFGLRIPRLPPDSVGHARGEGGKEGWLACWPNGAAHPVEEGPLLAGGPRGKRREGVHPKLEELHTPAHLLEGERRGHNRRGVNDSGHESGD